MLRLACLRSRRALAALVGLQLALSLGLCLDRLRSQSLTEAGPLAALALLGSALLIAGALRQLVHDRDRACAARDAAETRLRRTSTAFHTLLAERFAEWDLTLAERDVALFALKGLSLTQIAALRQTTEGTVKTQTNAIYRKAGVKGRPQFLSLFIDDLMQDAPPPPAADTP